MSMKATASKVLPRSELTSMRDENVREKLNGMEGTRPIKLKLWTTKHMQYKITSAKSEVVEDIATFSQTLMREHPEFRAHCGRAFTQYEDIRQR